MAGSHWVQFEFAFGSTMSGVTFFVAIALGGLSTTIVGAFQEPLKTICYYDSRSFAREGNIYCPTSALCTNYVIRRRAFFVPSIFSA